MKIWLTVVTLAAAIPQIILDLTDEQHEIIDYCARYRNERKYADKNFHQFMTNVQHNGSGKTPSLTRRPQKDRMLEKYAKEMRQLPFECISGKLDENSKSRLHEIEKYKELVRNCEAQKEEQVHCDPSSPYRTISGTCNNLKHPLWGSALSCLRRIMPAFYEGVAGFRRSVCGGHLPEPRVISYQYHTAKNQSSRCLSNMFPFFGQNIAHDITDVPVTSVENMTINCCADCCPLTVSRKQLHPQCAPIAIYEDDPFYAEYNVTCFNFIRSAPCDKCSLGPRIQMNGITSYPDASFIYGSNDKVHQTLRAFDGTGKLIVQPRDTGDLLPCDPVLGYFCGEEEKQQCCFLSGDRRTNQQTPLMSLQTIWIRKHNSCATKLKELNPKWTEEILFQETRKIIIALLQNIIYNEFLPPLIGPCLMTRYNLWILKEGHTRYDCSVNPSMIVEFNTAAYRLHSLVDPKLTYDYFDGDKKRLRDTYSRASPIYNNYMDQLLEGMCQKSSQKYDRYVTTDMTNFMYRLPGQEGVDIAAINIHRGRDHGLPPYTECIRFLSEGEIEINDFDELIDFIDQPNIDRLKKLYCDVRDIDMWVGLISERVPRRMAVGKTAAIIIAKQFQALKFGDRFYFEHQNVFTCEQLRTLREFTLSQLLCENTEITRIQKNALKLPSLNNPVQKCSDFPELDLSAWKMPTEICD